MIIKKIFCTTKYSGWVDQLNEADLQNNNEPGHNEPNYNHADYLEGSSQELSLRERIRSRPRHLDLENHTIEQNIWSLAVPLITERLLQSVVDAADMAMVGRVGAASVAAVGLSNQISLIATSFYDAIRVGTTSVVARRIGAGEYDDAQQTLRQSLIIASVLGILAFILIGALAGPSLRLMGAEQDVIEQGVPYSYWKGLSMLFQFVTMTFTAALRGSGNTRLPMYVGVLVNITNLLGNYTLITGKWGFPAMGTAGAGLSTAFARFLGMLLICYLAVRKENPISRFYKGSFRPDKDTLSSVMSIGLPASGERLTLRGAQLLYVRAIAGLGTNAYAAHQIALRIESISLVIGFSFGAAATTLVGQYLGFGDPKKAEEAGWKCQKLASLAMGCAGIGLFAAAPHVVHLFTPDNPEVIRLGSTVLRIVAVAQPIMGMNQVLAGSLRGAGDTGYVMAITGGSAWVVRVALTYFFVGVVGLHLPGAWYAMVADLTMRSLLFRWRFKTEKWKEIAV
jgi:putative MATE family efflux protein